MNVADVSPVCGTHAGLVFDCITQWSANIQTVAMGPTRLPPTPEEEEPPRQLSVEPKTPDTVKYEM